MRLRPLAWGVAAGSETALSLWRGVVTPPSCLLALPCLLVRRYRLVTGGSRESRDAELVSPSFTFTATWPPRGAGTRIHAIGTARAATRSRHIEHDRCGLAAVQMLRAVPS